jgi:SAM-dependent methyltransferase
MDEARRRLARHLVGTGIEIGPGHQPLPIAFPGVTVRYFDRWQPEESRALFPELGDAEFPEPDVMGDLDRDRLSPLADESEDFVIASHVLEHVAEPLGLLADIHRILRPGGFALVLLPDRRRTFDRSRPPTPLAHLVDEYRRGVTEVDDDHMVEFLTQSGEGASYTGMPSEADGERAAWFDWHRKRSIHVHCWTEDEFLEVLLHAVAAMGHQWEFVDGIIADDEGQHGIEFGYVLRRSTLAFKPSELAERFDATWREWCAARRALHFRWQECDQRMTSCRTDIATLRAQVAELEAVVAHQDRRLALFRRSPLYPVFRLAQRARRRAGLDS